jgi:hypothetical protein
MRQSSVRARHAVPASGELAFVTRELGGVTFRKRLQDCRGAHGASQG